jgi:hypothetical protein
MYGGQIGAAPGCQIAPNLALIDLNRVVHPVHLLNLHAANSCADG